MWNARELTFGSLNIKDSLSVDDARSDFLKFVGACGPQIIGLQEMGPDARSLLLDRTPHYSFVRFDSRNGQSNTAVAFKSYRFDLISAYPVLLSAIQWKRASGKVAPATWAAACRLRDRYTGKIINFMSVHTAPHIEPADLEARDASSQESLKTIGELSKDIPNNELFVVTGDFNWDAAHDNDPESPEQTLRPYGFISHWQALGLPKGIGTHGTRNIDYVFLLEEDWSQFTQHGIVHGLKSDHNGTWAKVRVRK